MTEASARGSCHAGEGDYAIEASHLSMRFGDFTAVDNVSFKIPRGEIFGFLGSNGCGKSTTMKMLTGFKPIAYDNLSTGHADSVRWGPFIEGDILDRSLLKATLKEFAPDAPNLR